MKILTSRTNPEIKAVTALHNAKYRKEQQKFIAEGTRTIKTLIESGSHLESLYVSESMADDARTLTAEDRIIYVSEFVMQKISTATTPSGILAVFDLPPKPSAKQLGSGMVLARIQDPGNTGTLIRSCAAMNIKSVVIIEGVDPWSPKVVQASAGTIGFVNIFSWSWSELLRHKGNLSLCALVVSGGKKPKEITSKNILLVVGSEAHGIPQEWLEQCNEFMTIEMPGNAESLNAAVAGSIALYLVFTQNS